MSGRVLVAVLQLHSASLFTSGQQPQPTATPLPSVNTISPTQNPPSIDQEDVVRIKEFKHVEHSKHG